MHARIAVVLGALAAMACTSTYHPEYHPVTVTTIHQTTSGATNAPPLVVPTTEVAEPEVVFK